jgi:hypothetical protein
MRPQGGFTAGLSPDAVKTAIDVVLYERFEREANPGYLSASNSFFFRTESIDKYAFIWDEDAGVPNFQKTGEQEDILPTDSWIGNTKTRFSQKYTSQVPISDEAFRADQVGKRNQLGVQQGDAARRTQDSEAILNTYGDAFAGAVNTCPDGQALASNSHLTLRGATVDTLETGVLNPDNLWTQTVSLAGQKGQHGDLGGHVFAGWVGPFVLYKTAKEVMNSSLLANSGENNLNVFDTDYGTVQIAASQFLGSAYNGASNANTSYSLVSADHAVMRKVFYGIESTMITPEMTDNDSYALRVKFHEVAFPGSWTGYVGSNGTT